jgi:pimeloyl-ACP methyl ester carboxylesterase
MRSRRALVAGLVALCVLPSAGCTSTSEGTVPIDPADTVAPRVDTSDNVIDESSSTGPEQGVAEQLPAPVIAWGPCDDPEAIDEALECGTLPVPLDHDDPAGEKIDIALVRVPAESPDDRVGAIVFNPGGPGASGFDYIAQGGPTIVSALGAQDFDLIGFDPRGVDRSNGLRCLSDAQQDAVVYLDESPDDDAEQAALDAADEQFATACVEKYGDTLRLYSTDATARDIDVIRIALGDDQISLLGVSYGTYLFATYATLFPDHVRAMVLDSAYEPTGDTVEQEYTTQLVGFEQAFDSWASWCQSSAACSFRAPDVGVAWDEVSAQLDETPVPADDGRLANQTVVEVATISALYSEAEWPVLADALAAVRKGDPSTLFDMADRYIGREPDGTFSTIQQAGRIIRCASGIDAAQPDDPAALVDTLHALAPRFSRDLDVDDFEDSCADLMPDVAPRALEYRGGAAIATIGGNNDPATPFRWAIEMDAAMGVAAGLVTYTGEGHGFLLTSTCVTDIEAATLVELRQPADGTVCEPDPEVPRPAWWNDLPLPDGVSEVFESPEVNALLGLGPNLAYTELHTSALTATAVLDAYDAALEAAGFQVGDRQQPLPGLSQGVYLQPDGDLFSVIAIGADSFDEPDLEGLADLVPDGQTLVVLLALPTPAG